MNHTSIQLINEALKNGPLPRKRPRQKYR